MELRTDEEIKKGPKKTAYHTMKPGMVFKVVELHRTEDIVTCTYADSTMVQKGKEPTSQCIMETEQSVTFYQCNATCKLSNGTATSWRE